MIAALMREREVFLDEQLEVCSNPGWAKWACTWHTHSGLVRARHGPRKHGPCLAWHEHMGCAWAVATAHWVAQPGTIMRWPSSPSRRRHVIVDARLPETESLRRRRETTSPHLVFAFLGQGLSVATAAARRQWI
jgi:hypothetical protein